jgi:hypothetical protein
MEGDDCGQENQRRIAGYQKNATDPLYDDHFHQNILISGILQMYVYTAIILGGWDQTACYSLFTYKIF